MILVSGDALFDIFADEVEGRVRSPLMPVPGASRLMWRW